MAQYSPVVVPSSGQSQSCFFKTGTVTVTTSILRSVSVPSSSTPWPWPSAVEYIWYLPSALFFCFPLPPPPGRSGSWGSAVRRTRYTLSSVDLLWCFYWISILSLQMPNIRVDACTSMKRPVFQSSGGQRCKTRAFQRWQYYGYDSPVWWTWCTGQRGWGIPQRQRWLNGFLWAWQTLGRRPHRGLAVSHSGDYHVKRQSLYVFCVFPFNVINNLGVALKPD